MALKSWLAWIAAILLGLDQVSIADGMGLRAIAEKNCICWQVGSLEELQNGKLNSIRLVILQEVWVVSKNWTGVAVATTF